MNILGPIIYTIVGGLIGFCGALIVEWYKRKQLEKDFKESLRAELIEAFPKFVFHYHLFNLTLGKINHNTLTWTHSMLSAADGETSNLIKGIEDLLKFSNDELTTKFLENKDFKTISTSFKKFNLSFLRENTPTFSLLDSNFRRSILDIRTKINWLNEDIDQYKFFYEQTFIPRLTRENWLNLNNNMKKTCEHMRQLCYELSEMIKELLF